MGTPRSGVYTTSPTWAAFIREHGEGIQHIGYAVDGIDERPAGLEARGVAAVHELSRLCVVGRRVANVAPESTNGVSFQSVQPWYATTRASRATGS